MSVWPQTDPVVLGSSAKQLATTLLVSLCCRNSQTVKDALYHFLLAGTGVRKGVDEDDLVALQLGKTRAEELSNVQQKYKDKLKQKLAEV